MSGKLVVQGVSQFAGLAGTVTIFIDGKKVDTVKPGQDVTIPIAQKCVLTVKNLAGMSKDSFQIEDNMRTVVKCDYSNRNGHINLTMVSTEPYEGASSYTETPIYAIQGVRGRSIKVFSDKCVISTKAGIGSFITGNLTDGEKTIYYIDCVGVQFRRSGTMIGYLQLETASAMMNNKGDNFFNENSFTFDTSTVSNEQMEEVAEYVKRKIQECKTAKTAPVTVAATSAADELKKFKELLDMGVITQEEFDAKKKQLLGL